MKLRFVSLVATMAMLSLIIASCTQAAPPPTPTKASVAPTGAAAVPTQPPAAPTKAAAAQPTDVPTKTTNFPEKGKSFTIIVPYGAGGGADVAARLLAVPLEKELGIPIVIVNKAGAGTQVGLTELAKAKPDGYTVGVTHLPATPAVYLDPERKAVFGRKDFQPLALTTYDSLIVAVKGDSPYKTFKDLVEAAKANPEKIKTGDVGILTQPHLGVLQTEELTGAKFAIVHFESSADANTAMLGGHIDAQFCYVNNVTSFLKDGTVRILGVMDDKPNKFVPEVKTMESQGYKLYSYIYRGYSLPSGVPKDVVNILAKAFEKAMKDETFLKKMEEQMYLVRYEGPDQYADLWDKQEVEIKPLIELARRQK